MFDISQNILEYLGLRLQTINYRKHAMLQCKYYGIYSYKLLEELLDPDGIDADFMTCDSDLFNKKY